MNQSRLFDRSWSVSLGPPVPGGGILQYQYEELRTTFDIEKNSVGSSNKAKIDVYGLSGVSRQTYQKGYLIMLQVGYQDSVETLFLGDIVRATTTRKGQEIVTSFECGDGEQRIASNHIETNYKAGTKLVQIFEDMARALGLSVGTVIGIQNLALNFGSAYSGTVARFLDQLCAQQALEWSVQNGYLQIIPLSAHSGDNAILLSNQTGLGNPGRTGLIGIPSLNGDLVQFSALMNPRLVPGNLVQIFSETINGVAFRINRSKFEGDSHGPKWGVQCEGVKVNAIQRFPQNVGMRFKVVV